MTSSPLSPVNRTKAEAKASYNKLSRWYDLFAGMERKYARAGIKAMDVKAGEKVLELGFGTGHSLCALAKLVGENGMVCGLDLSEGMISVAKKRLEKVRLNERIELLCGDAANLPYAERTFDAVFMCFTLELFDTPEIPMVLEQCKKVLKTSGRLSVVGMSKKGKANSMLKLYEWGHCHFPKVIDCRPIYLQQAMEEAGFIIQRSYDMKMYGLKVEVVTAGLRVRSEQ